MVVIYAVHEDVEYVRSIRVKTFAFSPETPCFHFDDVIPFAELNPDLIDYYPHLRRCLPPSRFLVGPQRDTPKIRVIFLPLWS